MNRRLSLALLACSLFLLATSVTQAAAIQLTETVEVTIDPPNSSVVLGADLDLQVSVVNKGPAETPPLVVHIDITKPDQATSVDPEDWTATLSQAIGKVAPGETVVVDWTIQPISSGTFVVYAVALSPGADDVAASNVLEVRVADQRSLNPGGILPVAIAAPLFIGGLLVLQLRLARRKGQEPVDQLSGSRA